MSDYVGGFETEQGTGSIVGSWTPRYNQTGTASIKINYQSDERRTNLSFQSQLYPEGVRSRHVSLFNSGWIDTKYSGVYVDHEAIEEIFDMAEILDEHAAETTVYLGGVLSDTREKVEEAKPEGIQVAGARGRGAQYGTQIVANGAGYAGMEAAMEEVDPELLGERGKIEEAVEHIAGEIPE